MSEKLQELQAQQETLKQAIKHEKRRLHEEAKTQGKTFWGKVERKLDEKTLDICKFFVERAEEIRRKKEDPKSYRAEQALLEARDHLSYYQKKVARGRELKTSDIRVLTKLAAAAGVIAADVEINVRTHTLANEVLAEVEKLVPTLQTAKDVEAKIDELIQQLDAGDDLQNVLASASSLASQLLSGTVSTKEPVPQPS